MLSDILPFVSGTDFYSYPYLYTAPTLQKPRKSSSGPRENARALKPEYERTPANSTWVLGKCSLRPCPTTPTPKPVPIIHIHTPTKSDTYAQATQNLTVNEGYVYIGPKMWVEAVVSRWAWSALVTGGELGK